MISDVTRRQFRKFRSIKRAWWSLWILVFAFVISLFSEFLANDRPLLMRYDGQWYFPTVRFYASKTFGGPYGTEADYKQVREDPSFKAKGGWMVFPPIPYGPVRPHLNQPGAPPHPPSREHWLGTDNAARDVAARLLYSFRTNMLFALCLTAVGMIVGVAIGSLQGYLGGRVDIYTQRLIEIWAALPFLYIVILIGSIYGRGFAVLVFVFAIFKWIGVSYYMRAEFFRLKALPFVAASRAAGASHARIILHQILPNAMTPVITLAPFMIETSISALTALDFLGFGMPPPTPSWGEMLQQGLENLYAPWLTIASVAALFITLLLASFVGEGARTAFDPRSV